MDPRSAASRRHFVCVLRSGPVRRLVALWALTAVGCGPPVVSLLSGDTTLVVLVGDEDRVFARAPRTASTLVIDDPRWDEAYELAYGCNLDVLGLAPGEVDVVDGGRPLPTPAQINLIGERGRPEPAEGDAFAHIRIPGTPPSACVDFDAETVALPDTQTDRARAFLRFRAGVLAVTQSGRALYVRDDGTIQTPPIRTSTVVLGAAQWMEGVFVVGSDGRTFSSDLTGGVVETPVRRTDRGRRRVAVAADDDVVYLVSDERSLERFDGTSFTVLAERPRADAYGSVTIHQSAVFATGIDDGVSLVSGSDVIEETVDGVPTIVRSLGSVGLYAGTETGVLLLRSNDRRWRAIASDPLEARVRIIERLNDGVLFGGHQGRFFQYHADETCEAQMLTRADAVHSTAYDGGIAVLARVIGDNDEVTFLKTRPGVAECSQ